MPKLDWIWTLTDFTVPDVATSMLGFRVWRYNEDDLSLWSVVVGDKPEPTAVELLLENTTPDGYWPKDENLTAKCIKHPSSDSHFPPDEECTCGIYATYDLNTIARYITQAPVLGLVQGGGAVIPGNPDGKTLGGFRAEHAMITCLFAISDDFTISHRELRKLGKEYGVPVVRPWSKNIGDYAAAVHNGTLEALGALRA